LGLVHMELKHFDQAIVIFKKILEKNPDADRIHYYLASIYEDMKDINLSVNELKSIKVESKLYGDAALHAAYLLKQESRMSDAMALMKQAIEKAPKNSSFYLFQASLAEESRDISGAVNILEKAVREFPEDEKIRYYLGSIFDRKGEIDRGLEQMEAILKFNPANVDALNYIGYTWTQKGIRLNDAEKLLKRALGLRPGNGYIQDSWGWYLYTRGRVKEAVVELEKAVKLKPNESTILEHLGDAYLRSNLLQKALIQYRDALKYAEDEGLKKKIQEKTDSLTKEIAENSTSAGPDSGFKHDDEDESGRMPASHPKSRK